MLPSVGDKNAFGGFVVSESTFHAMVCIVKGQIRRLLVTDFTADVDVLLNYTCALPTSRASLHESMRSAVLS